MNPPPLPLTHTVADWRHGTLLQVEQGNRRVSRIRWASGAPVASDTLYLFLVRAVGDELDMPKRRVMFPKP